MVRGRSTSFFFSFFRATCMGSKACIDIMFGNGKKKKKKKKKNMMMIDRYLER